MVTVRALLDVVGETIRLVEGEAGLDAVISEVVIAGPGDLIPTTPGALVLCIGDRSQPTEAGPQAISAIVVRDEVDMSAWSDRSIAVLAADPAMPWQHVFQVLTAAVAISTDRKSAAVGDLFTLAESLAATLGGAVSIEDNRQHILAYSSVADQVIDEVRRQGILGRQTPALERNQRVYAQLRRTQGAVPFDADGDVLPRLGIAIRSGHEVIGSIWVIAATQLAADANRTLVETSRLAAVHLLHMRGSADIERTMRSEVLRGLLDGRTTPDAAGRRLRIDPRTPVVILGFGLPESLAADDSATGMVADMAHLRCSSIQLWSTVTVQLGTVYVLLPAGGISRANLLRVVTSVVERAGVALGTSISGAVGTEVDSIDDIQRSREDVDDVLKVVSPGEAATIEDKCAQVSLARIRSWLLTENRSFLPSVERMVTHDLEQGTNYCESVLAYLASNSDIRTAAQRVSVHPNTFRYRLRRANELFEVDLADPDMRLLTWMQIRTLG